jgi:carbonic anhydrase
MTLQGLEALGRLKEGNLRYSGQESGGKGTVPSLLDFSDLSAGQRPFVAVVACSDSRVPVEAIFSQGPGSIFVIRVAGNVMGPPQLGSLEYAAQELGVPLVVVLGHTECGAVGAALASAKGGVPPADSRDDHLGALLDPIYRTLEKEAGPRLTAGTLDPTIAVRLNALGACEEMLEQSTLLASRVQAGRLLVVGATYDLRTGRVDFLE